MKRDIHEFRYFLKDSIRKEIDFSATDQNTGIPMPPAEKPCRSDAAPVRLPGQEEWRKKIGAVDLTDAIAFRESRRIYTAEPLIPEELSYLLWATQGIRKIYGKGSTLRTVPSAGARHSFETYLVLFNVDGIDEGLYRYLPFENALEPLMQIEKMKEKLVSACLYQDFVGRSAVTFVWTTIPYRMEWRYSLAAHRVILIDAGHVCQNLYLACGAVGAGTCAIAAYDQEAMDMLIGVDGEEQFTVYLAPVGKVES